MKTVTAKIKTDYREKGSKFIGYLFPVQTKNEFDKQLDKIKDEYYDASHHCYAWRVDPNDEKHFTQDDGEPNGTAGLPILNQLKSFEAVSCAVVVVRYFGGTKLGKSGLIDAYGYTAELCLRKAQLKSVVTTRNFRITYPYSAQSKINQLKNNFDLKEIQANYLEKVTIEIACRLTEAPALYRNVQKLEHLDIEIERKDKSFVVKNS